MIVRRFFSMPTVDRRGPFEEFERLRRQMEGWMERFPGATISEPAAGVFPLVNVTEDKDNYYVRAELPGLKSEEINISVTGNSLAISGERKFPTEEKKVRYYRREREAGRFNRVLSLPGQIEMDQVKAKASDGILTIILPKAESEKPRQISVQTA